MEKDECLWFEWKGKQVPVTHPSIERELARLALASEPFTTWSKRCAEPHGDKKIELHSVEIQSVDLFGKSRVGFVKVNANCTLVDGDKHYKHPLPGVCFLRGNAVAILVALFCSDGRVYSLLVEQPRIPIGHVSVLELPAGMIDVARNSVAGAAAKEMEEECGIKIKATELIDLTEIACKEAVAAGNLLFPGVTPSPGGCDEFLRILYLEKSVTENQLQRMKGRLAGLREQGELITLRVVPFDDVWKVSGNSNAMCGLFMLDQLRKEAKLPKPGHYATPLSPENPTTKTGSGTPIPQLAFGLYKIPASEEGERIILQAMKEGYRHFDTASYYGNEETLGNAMKRSGIPREDFYICSKVWNDAQKEGRVAVRKSVERTLKNIQSEYIDLFLIHWPVPGCFIETYKELELLYSEKKIHALGLSNFSIPEYEALVAANITVLPAVNQFEVSPAMFRSAVVEYFQDKGMVVGASKSLNRGAAFENSVVSEIAQKHSITPAQVFLRWGLQKGLVVLSKTASASRMAENRSILDFELDDYDVMCLDGITTEKDVEEREELEKKRKSSM